MNNFSRDLWIYIWDCGIDVRRHIKTYYTDLKDSEIESRSDSIKFAIAYAIAEFTGRPLPDHLHSRMLLENNEWTKKYVRLIST